MMKPCPSCGGDKIRVAKILRTNERLFGWLPHRWWCECDNCHFCGPTKWTRKGAEKAWNSWKGVIIW